MLRAPFPWLGGKRLVAPEVWERLGNVPNYVEPFFGTGAVLLGRPTEPSIETANDLDGFVCNLWRSILHDPETVAEVAAWPVHECDLHARHCWLIQQREDLTRRLEGDPDFYDAALAGWWVWGQCLWLGTAGWCSPRGSWWPDEDGPLVQTRGSRDGVDRKKPDTYGWKGVKRQMPEMTERGIRRQRPHLFRPMGVWRQMPQLSIDQGVRRLEGVLEWLQQLSARLARVRFCCGDWSRVLGPSVTWKQGLTGVFFDPPYGEEVRDPRCYSVDSLTVAADVREWCLKHGQNKLLRIALCGMAGEHEALEEQGWTVHAWTRSGGANRGSANAARRSEERIWFSPACLAPQAEQPTLFEEVSCGR